MGLPSRPSARPLTPATMYSGPQLSPEHRRQLRIVSRAQMILDAACESEDGEVLGFPPLVAKALQALTHKQRKFALYVSNGLAAQVAYKSAYNVSDGRSDNELSGEIANLKGNARVAHCIDLLQTWVAQKWLLESADARDWALAHLYEQATMSPKPSDRIKATELILRAHGGLTDKKEIIHRDGKDVDNAAAALQSMLDTLGMTVDASYSLANEPLETPSLGAFSCPRCSGAVNTTFEDGAGI